MHRSVNFTAPVICPKRPQPKDIKKLWYVSFRFRNPDTGQWVPIKKKKGINLYKNFRERLAEANALREALYDLLCKGWNPITKTFDSKVDDPLTDINELSKMPFRKAVEYALKNCHVSPRTFGNYRNSSQRIMKAARGVEVAGSNQIYDFANLPIEKIQKKHIKLLLAHCKKTFKWSNKAYNKHMGYFKSVLARLEDDVIPSNPAHGLKYLPVMETKKFIPYTEDEKKQIRDKLYLEYYGLFVILMVEHDTGMRPNEILALKIPDINLQQKMITIIPDITRDNSKTKNIRMVPMTDAVFFLLKEWVKHPHGPADFVFGSPYKTGKGNRGKGVKNEQYFKPSPVRIKRDTITKLWKKVVIDGLGIKKYLYAGKHTGADAKILAGISVDALQSMYGHTSKYMTLKYITELKEIHAREIREKSPTF